MRAECDSDTRVHAHHTTNSATINKPDDAIRTTRLLILNSSSGRNHLYKTEWNRCVHLNRFARSPSRTHTRRCVCGASVRACCACDKQRDWVNRSAAQWYWFGEAEHEPVRADTNLPSARTGLNMWHISAVGRLSVDYAPPNFQSACAAVLLLPRLPLLLRPLSPLPFCCLFISVFLWRLLSSLLLPESKGCLRSPHRFLCLVVFSSFLLCYLLSCQF